MKKIKGGVTAAKGYRAAGAEAGIKYKNRPDVALIVSDVPALCAGTFTRNVVKAAPVLWDRDIVKNRGKAGAIVVNSGIANACTGEEGMAYCRQTAEYAASKLGLTAEEVLVGSTGVIGMQLNMEALLKGIDKAVPELGYEAEKGTLAERAIMTTDTKPKEAAVSFELGGKTVTIGGMCKGSGMIHPNMCTMLSFVTTDAAIDGKLLQKALSDSVDESYNMVSVDGDTSTNDTCILLANGMAENPRIEEENEDYRLFKEGLDIVNTELARMIAGDGEGATALIESLVVNADTRENARTLAKAVITSSLTKAAVFGHDANWGRILCALGYSGVEFDPDGIELYIRSRAGEILIFKDGKQAEYTEEMATAVLSEPEVEIVADMHMGDVSATAWGCDLSYDYVKINADYRT